MPKISTARIIRYWYIRGTVAAMVAESLGKIRDERAVEPLIHALKDKDTFVASCAAKALGNIGNAHAVEALQKALECGASEVRSAAAEALDAL